MSQFRVKAAGGEPSDTAAVRSYGAENRGFAIFGMLLVNMSYDLPWGFLFAKLWSGRTDITALELVHFFGDHKFRTLFSFLFGLGFRFR